MANEQLTSTFISLGQQLLGVAMRITGNRDDAADAVQDAFVRLWQRKLDPATIAGLAVTTVHNVSIDQVRRRNARPQQVAINEMTDADHAVSDEGTTWQEREQMLGQVQAIVDSQLPPRQRQVMQLREFQGLPFGEVAQRLGMTPEAVRMELSRARKRVREIYRSKQGGDTL